MMLGRVLMFAGLMACASSMALTTELVSCPCETAGAFIQLDAQLVQADDSVKDLNATGNADVDGNIDSTLSDPVDLEHDSVCVCKRVKKPDAPVRCTKPNLLHGNCNDRDKMREKGFEIAPADKIAELYPDELPPAPAGKVFHDAAVEKYAVKNVKIEDKTVITKTKSVQQSGKTILLAKEDIQPDQPEAPATTEEAPIACDDPTPTPAAIKPIISLDELHPQQKPTYQAPPEYKPTLTPPKKDPSFPLTEEVKKPEPVAVYTPPSDANANAGDVEYTDGTPLTSEQIAQPKSAPPAVTDEQPVIEQQVPTPLSPSGDVGGPGVAAVPAEEQQQEQDTTESITPPPPSPPTTLTEVTSAELTAAKLEEQKMEIDSLKTQLSKLETLMEGMNQQHHVL